MRLKVKIFTIASICLFALVHIQGAEFAGDEACVQCHAGETKLYENSLHSMGYKNTENTCESCHGGGAKHAATGNPDKVLTFSDQKKENEKFNSNCLSCHPEVRYGTKGEHIDSFNLNCGTCHKIHQPAPEGTLAEKEKKLCESCHKTVRAKSMLPSHHPIREDKMKCTSCHSMTGTSAIDLERPNDTCLDCHSQYRGPFVFEHAPVTEDCTICHNPHGSVANNLLKQNEPFLCLQCHDMHFHTQLAGEEGSGSGTPEHPGRSWKSDRYSGKKSFLTNCSQCHQSIHGTDNPSQSISGQGKALTR